MVNYCVAYGCRSRATSLDETRTPVRRISFHRFPLNNSGLVKKWIAAVQRSNWAPTKYSSLCSRHFRDDDYYRDRTIPRLKENAVPSIFPFSILKPLKERCFLERYAMENTASSHNMKWSPSRALKTVKKRPFHERHTAKVVKTTATKFANMNLFRSKKEETVKKRLFHERHAAEVKPTATECASSMNRFPSGKVETVKKGPFHERHTAKVVKTTTECVNNMKLFPSKKVGTVKKRSFHERHTAKVVKSTSTECANNMKRFPSKKLETMKKKPFCERHTAGSTTMEPPNNTKHSNSEKIAPGRARHVIKIVKITAVECPVSMKHEYDETDETPCERNIGKDYETTSADCSDNVQWSPSQNLKFVEHDHNYYTIVSESTVSALKCQITNLNCAVKKQKRKIYKQQKRITEINRILRKLQGNLEINMELQEVLTNHIDDMSVEPVESRD